MEEPNKEEVKMAGYLEKKGKMKVMAVWKQYWFVLEGHLLLYYRSQLEYLNLSACKGSLNMGLASSIRPGLNRPNIIEVITPTKIITLKAKDRGVQEQWLQALLDSLATPPTARTSTGPMQLRYSLDNLPTAAAEVVTGGDRPLIGRRDSVLSRIRRLGGRSYAGGSLETVVRKPKLPKGQAVSRMVALQEPHEACSTCDENQNRNSAGDSTEKLVNEDADDYYYVENKMYHKAHYHETDNVLYNIKVNGKDRDDGMYELVPEAAAAAASTKTEEPTNAANNTDEEYYDSYDPVATAKRSTPSPEPDLPPRPRTFSNETSSNATVAAPQVTRLQQEDDDVEYADCTEMIINNNKVDEVKVAASAAEKKHDKKAAAAKKKIKIKGNKANKAKAANDDSGGTEKKEEIPLSKKRRMSFLKKVLGHYRKKNHHHAGKEEDEVVAADDTAATDSNTEEPAYETVDFVVEATAGEETPAPPSGFSLVGKHSLMPNNALLELENKLQGRHMSEQTKTARGKESESITSATKNESVDETIKSDGKTSPPELPRRQNETPRRPSSPWHDVPTNNSPVAPTAWTTVEQRDSLLGTPQGFALLKSRWQAAERGGEWNKEHRNPTESNVDHSGAQVSDLYSKVNKKPKATTRPDDVVAVDRSSGNSLIFQMDVEETTDHSGNFQADSLTSVNKCTEEERVPELPAKRQTLDVEQDARYSNELNNLLAQLVKITSAPLMAPGNTTSLVDFPPAKLSEADEQLLLMAPVRRRRYSEPDYDVPRSHRYIFDSSADSKNGTLLTEEEHVDNSSSCNVSMAPDSLEPMPTAAKDKATENFITR